MNKVETVRKSRSKSVLKASGINVGDRLLFAVPKKGRLHEPCMNLLKGADLQFHRKNRLDIALCKNLPVALVFLPASDIGQFVGEGSVDLGITGWDVIVEADMQDKVELVSKLGFGKCRLSVQAPEDSGITSTRQLVGKRVVTSFERVTNDYFTALSNEKANGEDVERETRIGYLSGSVEAACSLGLADAVVDLVESGETMRAAGLYEVETILESEACLIANPRGRDIDLMKQISRRVLGVLAASSNVLVKYNIPRDLLKQAIEITPGNRAPTISPLDDNEWLAVEAMIKKSREGEILDQLELCGAKDVLVLEIKNCRVD